ALRDDFAAVSSIEDKGYALPDQFVCDGISRPIVEIDVDDGDVEVIACGSAVRCIKVTKGSNDTRAVGFERYFQIVRQKILVLDDENTATV
ncbi:hypothetical protein XH94_17980, partial [Bradyrhizobium zhanjiangense]